MCGIMGYIGGEQASAILLDGLRRLAYRGYDSAGIAVVNGTEVQLRRAEGKLIHLEEQLAKAPVEGTVGIGHTRWATHGRPSETNAHPHRSGDIIVVHNGIIENHVELKTTLRAEGHQFESETDTEVVCHLVDSFVKRGKSTIDAIRATLLTLRGSYSLVILNAKEPSSLYVARRGSPLVVGKNGTGVFVASDIPAILPHTKQMLFLVDGDLGIVTRTSVSVTDTTGKNVERPVTSIPWSPVMAERGGYKHFMLKEIFEQPRVIEDALSGRIVSTRRRASLEELAFLCGGKGFPFREITILACGTSYHAGLVGKYLIEDMTGLRVTVELSSEFRYRKATIADQTLVIPISQSGETTDTLAAIDMVRERGLKTLSICNVVGSSITRATDATLYTHAGPEIGVASTKAFTTQLVTLLLAALDIGARVGKIDEDVVSRIIADIVLLPRQMKDLFGKAKHIQAIAEQMADANHALYIGRGIHYPIALEGALKLKEISYLHAEGFAAGELKHGPIALVDHGVPVVAIALRDAVYEKMCSNIEEVKARGAHVIALATEGDEEIKNLASDVIVIPETSWHVSSVLSSIPLQLLAYYVADHKGTDVDQPRNLAKSVTVE